MKCCRFGPSDLRGSDSNSVSHRGTSFDVSMINAAVWLLSVETFCKLINPNSLRSELRPLLTIDHDLFPFRYGVGPFLPEVTSTIYRSFSSSK